MSAVDSPPYDGAAVSTALDLLAKKPEFQHRAPEFAALRRALAGDADAIDAWAELDLLAVFGTPGTPRPLPPRRPWVRQALTLASGGLVFVPILITWLGLSTATEAYGVMLADPAGRAAAAGRDFLQLWLDGFGGRLPGPLHLTGIALYTLAAIVLLLVVTVTGSWLGRRDEQRARDRREELTAELVPLLVQAQTLLNRHRLASPVRFAAELTGAAQRLGELLERVARTQADTEALARRNAEVSDRLHGAVTGLGTAVETLQHTGTQVNAATDGLIAAVDRLGEEVTGRTTAATALLEATAQAAATRVERTAEAAAARIAELQRAGQEALAAAAERMDAALADLADRVATATDRLIAAGDGFAAAIHDSADRAARDVGQTYQEAVAAAAVTMAEQMTQVGAELAAIVGEAQAAAARHLAAVRTAEETHAAHTAELTRAATGVAEAGSAIAAATDRLGAHTLQAADRLDRARSAVDRQAEALLAATERARELESRYARHTADLVEAMTTTGAALDRQAQALLEATEQTRELESRYARHTADLVKAVTTTGTALDRQAEALLGVTAQARELESRYARHTADLVKAVTTTGAALDRQAQALLDTTERAGELEAQHARHTADLTQAVTAAGTALDRQAQALIEAAERAGASAAQSAARLAEALAAAVAELRAVPAAARRSAALRPDSRPGGLPPQAPDRRPAEPAASAVPAFEAPGSGNGTGPSATTRDDDAERTERP